MKRTPDRKRPFPREAKRPPRRGPPASTAPMGAGDFLIALRRGQVAHPDSTELRGGWPALLSPAKGQAAGVLKRLEEGLARAAYRSRAHVLRNPLLQLGAAVLWRPSIALLPAGEAASRHLLRTSFDPRPALLVVLLSHGREESGRLAGYAAAGVAELWSVSLCEGFTVRYRSPWAGKYRSRTLWYPGEGLPVAALPGAQVEALEAGFQPAAPLAGGPDCGGSP